MLTESLDAPLLLIVEDNPDHRDLMHRSLDDSEEPYRLSMAASLAEAVKIIEQQQPHIILTDFRLPDGEGSSLLPYTHDRFPVVMMTSQGNEQVAVKAMKSGMLDYVVKSSSVFAGISRIVQRGLREWGLIQEQKLAEEKRQQLERQLLHVQKLESLVTMSSGIAHDFNNLLQVLLGNLEMAFVKIPEDAPFRKYICQANEAAKQAALLSGKMLAYSGKGFYNKHQIHINNFFESNRSFFDAAVNNHIDYKYAPDDTIPLVMADVEQIRQVVVNLLLNASEAIGDPLSSISVKTGSGYYDGSIPEPFVGTSEPDCAAGWYVWFEVIDSGCGIGRDNLHKIFDPFFTTKFPGRGLGMSAVKGIVHAHEGTVLIDSSPGNGTAVRVMLPVATT